MRKDGTDFRDRDGEAQYSHSHPGHKKRVRDHGRRVRRELKSLAKKYPRLRIFTMSKSHSLCDVDSPESI